MNNKCNCDGSGWIEVDPRNPREASTPQTMPCSCVEEEAQYKEDTAYDDYEDK